MMWLAVAVNTGIFVVFNPVPELIYQGSATASALLEDAVQFIRDNTIEWLVPLAICFRRSSPSTSKRASSPWRTSARRTSCSGRRRSTRRMASGRRDRDSVWSRRRSRAS